MSIEKDMIEVIHLRFSNNNFPETDYSIWFIDCTRQSLCSSAVELSHEELFISQEIMSLFQSFQSAHQRDGLLSSYIHSLSSSLVIHCIVEYSLSDIHNSISV